MHRNERILQSPQDRQDFVRSESKTTTSGTKQRIKVKKRFGGKQDQGNCQKKYVEMLLESSIRRWMMCPISVGSRKLDGKDTVHGRKSSTKSRLWSDFLGRTFGNCAGSKNCCAFRSVENQFW
jgi:hypothetical protein